MQTTIYISTYVSGNVFLIVINPPFALCCSPSSVAQPSPRVAPDSFKKITHFTSCCVMGMLYELMKHCLWQNSKLFVCFCKFCTGVASIFHTALNNAMLCCFHKPITVWSAISDVRLYLFNFFTLNLNDNLNFMLARKKTYAVCGYHFVV